LVYHASASGSEVNWNGRDDQGNLVGDGLYLVRIVNEESKSLIAKGKVLVIKRVQ
jgi:flagellar hook assembly protein FlgD